MATYSILNMRAVKTTGKLAEKHPDRWLTIYGEFYKDGVQLSFTSKEVTFEDAKHPDFQIDLTAGTLTLNEGKRGRKQIAGITQDDILADLAAMQDND